jgi:N-acetylmuramoyl-L-alanine amidase
LQIEKGEYMEKKLYRAQICVAIIAFIFFIIILFVTQNTKPISSLTPREIELIERVVECEVRGNDMKDYEAKLAVANVILNRYHSDYWEFPDTIEEIIFQKNQFTPASSNIFYTIEISDVTKRAVEDAINGKMVIDSNVYAFCTVDCKNRDWFEENLVYYGRVGPHVFYSYKE